MTINILGSDWTIKSIAVDKSADLDTCCGATIRPKRLIELRSDDYFSRIDSTGEWKNRTLRHELIHAFMEESGLEVDNAELMTEWMAVQIPKMVAAMEAAGCLRRTADRQEVSE